MVLFQVLYFSLLINELTLLILQRLLRYNPVVVQSFTLLLEIGQQLLLLLKGSIEGPQLLAQVEAVLLGFNVLNLLGLVDALLLNFFG